MNQKVIMGFYDENTTVKDIVLSLNQEDFGDIKFKDFYDALLNQTLVTHGHTHVDYDVVISKKFKHEDRLFI